MEKYSCWTWPYCKRYYLTHPWKWFSSLWRNIKDVCMRARYGFTWTDVWNWDHWFLHTTPNMLRHIAAKGNAYPGYPPFDTSEKWHDWLNEIADLLETGNEDWQDEHNEYHDEYMKYLENDWEPMIEDENGMIHHKVTERPEICEKYMTRANELAKQGNDNVRRAVTAIAEHFFEIWD